MGAEGQSLKMEVNGLWSEKCQTLRLAALSLPGTSCWTSMIWRCRRDGSSELLSCHSFKGLTGPEERRGGFVHTLCPILGIPVC